MNKKYLLSASLILAVFSCRCQKGPAENEGPSGVSVPAVPSGLVCNSTDSTSLAFSWDEVKDADSYQYKLLEGMTLVQDGNTDSESVVLEGLKPSTTYRFAVKGLNEAGSSKYSDYLEAKTSEGRGDNPGEDPVPVPDPVENLYESLKIPAWEEDGVARAFPGAEGGGMYTTGGRGGKVLHVTSLEDSDEEGTLRWAVGQKGARTIVFDVAGIITLKSPLNIKYGDLTIAGQTAPGDGICLKGRYTQISADNIIIRFIRFRLGDEDPNAGDSDDTIYGRYHNNIIIDHCSMSWSIDECASFYSNSNFTLQWCYLAESMRNSYHAKGSHGYGGIWGGENASFHHNVLAHHDSRNPRFDHPHIYEDHNNPAHRGVIDYRNNVVYDWGSNSSYGGEGYGVGKGTGINMVANCYKPGPSSTDRKYFLDSYGVYTSTCSSCGGKNLEEGYPLVYLEGNVHTQHSDITADNASGIYWHNGEAHANYGKTASAPFPLNGPESQTCYTSTHSAELALEAVLQYGGASLRRDLVDERVASDVENGTGQIIDCVSATEGKVSVASLYNTTWPKYTASEQEIAIASTDSDSDGIPDYYETLFGLDPKNPSDAAEKGLDKHGRYSNFEIYLHYLVKDIVAESCSGAAYTAIK